MYAIVEINGQQFKAEEGKKLFVNHIKDAEEGKAVEFDKVLLVDNNGTVTVGAPTVEGAKVGAEVVAPLVKGDKVIVFKMKRRKDYRKKNGHRTHFTQVEINGQQFKAEEGKKLFVNHIKDAEEGKAVEFDKVLLVDNNGAVTVGAPTVEGAKVVAEVVAPLVKGDKVVVFKMKRRKDYRKKNGHRSHFTQVEIKSINA